MLCEIFHFIVLGVYTVIVDKTHLKSVSMMKFKVWNYDFFKDRVYLVEINTV